MNKFIKPLYFFILLVTGFQAYPQALPIIPCEATSENIDANYSKSKNVTEVLQQLVKEGAPGVSMALYSDSEGWWESSAGYAKIEDNTLMQSCHLQYLQSVSKTYMAIAILKLVEQGKLDIEETITRYLPEKYFSYI